MNKSNGLQKQEKKLRALDDNQARGDDGSGDANKKREKMKEIVKPSLIPLRERES